MDGQRLKQIYDDLGRPSARVFRDAVLRKGGRISDVEARDFVGAQSESQIFQSRVKSDGKHPGGGKVNMRWTADLIDFSKRLKKPNLSQKYVLIVISNFDRMMFTTPQKSKTAEATLDSFKRILRMAGDVTPAEVLVDNGAEFNLLPAFLESKGGVLSRKSGLSPNSLSLVDAAIGTLKQILSGYSLVNWASSLQRATQAYNDRSHSHLMGSQPNEVKGNAELQFELIKDNGEKLLHNNQQWRKKVDQLQQKGGFRTPLPRSTWQRIDQATYSGVVKQVSGYKGSHVIGNNGESFEVKTVLPVPSGNANIDLQDSGPGQGKRAILREQMIDFARELEDLIPSTGMSLSRASTVLKAMRGFLDTADVYGLARAGRYVSFLKLYPQKFTLTGSGQNIKVTKTPPREAAASSSSSAPVPIPRTPREPYQIDTPYRRFPNQTKTEYGPNPARQNTPRHRRYQKYSVATTIGEARRLGATSQDISLDIASGALKIT